MAKHHDKPATRLATNKPQHKRIKVCARFDNNKDVPWIQMRGQWLEQLGFEIDTPITVRAMNGCLVLTAEETIT
jgi:hypothetical protein